MYTDHSYIKQLTKLGQPGRFRFHNWEVPGLHCDADTVYLDSGFLQYSGNKIT